MKTYINTLICFLALSLIATSCHKDDNEDPTHIEEKDFQTVPYSFTATLTPMSDNPEGIELKKAFANGDVIEVTNAQILYEPLVLSCTEFNGKTSATFSGELKVKKDVDVASTLSLSAVLKNTNTKTLYNSGKPFTDVVEISNTTDGFDQYSYWSCANIVDNKIELTQSTVFVKVNMPFGIDATIKNGQAEFSDVVLGEKYFAAANGTSIESKTLKVSKTLNDKDKLFYTISSTLPKDCLPGIFSISENKTVFFSKGNLQYKIDNGQDSWQLAPQQYNTCFDVSNQNAVDLGEDYANYPLTDNWTDLFWWGAWIKELAHNRSGSNTDNYDIPIGADNCISGTCAFGAEWSVLSVDEWDYLIGKRPDANKKNGGAIVANKQGWIILPDVWNTPEGIKPFVAPYDEVKYVDDIPNHYTAEEWEKMESAGAVFLPFTGEDMFGTACSFMDDYQTKTYKDDTHCLISFLINQNIAATAEDGELYGLGYYWGTPVRLIQDNNAKVQVE